MENTTSAESAIRDTDIATEMVKYANNNILAHSIVMRFLRDFSSRRRIFEPETVKRCKSREGFRMSQRHLKEEPIQ